MGCSHYLPKATHTKIASTRNLEEAMTKFPLTRSNQPDIVLRAAVIEASAEQKELQLDPPEPGGVLKELALARWRGLTTEPRSSPR